jgi:hypothetical protein
MNERIRELMPQAYELVRKNHDGYFTQELLLNYMAELIALECAELLEKQHSWITNIAASKLIRQHFGVK